MRVNVSYSVELEDVLKEVHQMYVREKAKLEDSLGSVERSLEQKYTDKNLSEILHAVEEYRNAIGDFDIKLTEMAAILSGYSSLKEQLKAPPQQQNPGESEQT